MCCEAAEPQLPLPRKGRPGRIASLFRLNRAKYRAMKDDGGVMCPSSAMFLQQMILNPKMAYAVKHARFPISVLFDFLIEFAKVRIFCYICIDTILYE